MVSTFHMYYLATLYNASLLTIVTILCTHTHTHTGIHVSISNGILFSTKKKAIQPFVTTGKYLEGSMLNKSEKDYDFTYMWNLEKLNSQKQRVQWWLPWPGGVGNGKMLVKVYKLLVIRWVSSGHLMYSMVTRKRTMYTLSCVIIRKHFKSVGGTSITELVSIFKKQN